MGRQCFASGWVAIVSVAVFTACADQPTQPRPRPQAAVQQITILPGRPTLYLTLLPASSPRSGDDIGILSTTTFSRFARSPAEGGGFVEIPVGGTAYFRDVAFSADFVFEADADGDFWDATISGPAGGASFPRLTYHRELNGAQDCWVASGGQPLCGSTTIFVSYILGIQCLADGAYTVRVLQNGGEAFSGIFNLVTTLPPGSVPHQLQLDHAEPYDSLCQDANDNSYHCRGEPNETKRTIQQKGCALSSASMVLNYFGVPTDPVTLNEFLIGLGEKGYNPDGGVIWDGILQRAAQDNQSLRFIFDNMGDSPTQRQNLRNRLCRFGPQMVEVNSLSDPTNPKARHFVVITGVTDGDFTISDPADRSGERTLNSYPPFLSVREFEPRTQTTWDDVLLATLHSPAELVLTDPQGRRAGYDPVSGQVFTEIPNSSYDSTGLGTVLDDGSIVGQDPLWKEMYVRFPIDGQYTMSVTGTANGSYTLNLLGYDRDHRSAGYLTQDVPIAAGEVHQYAFTFNGADMSGGTLTISGGFNGGGQRSDVNAMLSYIRPAQTRTSLAAGTASYSVMVSYGATIDPTTFRAELNGAVVTELFTPTPGSTQTVALPLVTGRNVLLLSVAGGPGGPTGTDRDRLVFLVP